MSFKLGQILLKAGRITLQQLDEALRHQVVHGGKLGTNLIELGYITEHELSLVLGHKLGVPFIKQEQVLSLTPQVTGLIPADMATRYRVIPIEVERRRMTLAMTDPTDLEAIDAISFYTGMIVSPIVCPELLLNRLHEKYYGVRPKPRPFVPAPSKLPQQESSESSPPRNGQPAHPSSPSNSVINEYELPLFDDFEGFHSLEGDQFDELYLKPAYYTSASLEQVSRELADARNRDAIADTVLRFLGIAFPVEAFILVRADSFNGWKAHVRGEEIKAFLDFTAPISEPSVLSHVCSSRSFFLGPPPDTPVNRDLSRLLGGKREGHALVLPLVLLDRVVSMLYIEGEPEQLASRLGEVQKLAAKAAMAFEILILKNKILMS